jgi:ADP-ribose pyrophosphatase YjhB (NUDIX family)
MKKGVDYPGVTVVFACHDGKGNFLLSKRGANCRDEEGRWNPGGGAVDVGDSLDDTLRKEIREEYCADVLGAEFLGHFEVFREHEGVRTHWVAFCYKVLLDPAQVRIGEPHKIDDIGWFPLDALPEPMHSQWSRFAALYGERLKEGGA